MKAIKNISKFFDSLTDAILSQKDTYIFGYKCEDEADYYFDDEDEETNCFYVSAGFNFAHLQKVLFETWVGDEDLPILIVLDWYKEDGSDEEHYKMVQRLHIFWTDDEE